MKAYGEDLVLNGNWYVQKKKDTQQLHKQTR